VPVTASSPRRLLVVSATIGEGHNATARAIEERARRLWPGCQIRRVDTLELMGSWVGPGFRWIYRVNVDTTPWLYDFFYRSLWRYPWFATASCRFTGVWSGLRLAPIIAEYQPDLVVSTYPLGTGGLDWIRRRGGLEVPVAAIISDFAPHPFWVYPDIDLHYVASEASLWAMHRARPDARGAVGAPPVVEAFHPASRIEKIIARRRCGLPETGLVVLVSCGSLGFGSVERAVAAGLAAGPEICVVVACGRNETLRARLVARNEPARRLVALGWTSEMPALTAAADVVVTNAGGATALEALACARAVLMFEPIAGHGKANAALMAQAGLADVCESPAELVAALRALTAQPARLAAAEQRARTHIGALDFDAEIAALPELPTTTAPGPWPHRTPSSRTPTPPWCPNRSARSCCSTVMGLPVVAGLLAFPNNSPTLWRHASKTGCPGCQCCVGSWSGGAVGGLAGFPRMTSIPARTCGYEQWRPPTACPGQRRCRSSSPPPSR
jgi:diacylglycerol O-acyltransferase